MHPLSDYGADERRVQEAAAFPEGVLGRVTAQFQDAWRIRTEDGERLATASGKFRARVRTPDEYPAVGDFVIAECDAGGGAQLHRVLTRRSCFARVAPGGNLHRRQVVAANVDTVFVCMAAGRDFNLSRLERYLSVAWDSGATPVAVLTKADLCEELPEALAEITRAAPGVQIIASAADDPEVREKLLACLGAGKTGAFIGSSGVGKSTLINRLAGEALFETGEVRRDGKGRHTTTRRELALLPEGGVVIDTPGMRELAAASVDLSRAFADIEALSAQCRFSDCAHGAEPGCAVRRAIADGTLDERRLQSYLRLRNEPKYEGLSAKAIEQQKGERMFAAVGGVKNVRRYIRENDKRRGDS